MSNEDRMFGLEPWQKMFVQQWDAGSQRIGTVGPSPMLQKKQVDEEPGVTRTCDGCGKIEDAGTQPDQDGLGRSQCCWSVDDSDVEFGPDRR